MIAFTTGSMSLRKVAVGGGDHIRPALSDCLFSSSSSSEQSDFYLPRVEELEITTTTVMVDLRPYDRGLGVEFPSNLSCFHEQLSVYKILNVRSGLLF